MSKSTLSRRAALAGGASVIALAATATVAVPATAHDHPDAELLRRADKAMRAEAEQNRLWDICHRVREQVESEPECPPLPDWSKHHDDYDAGRTLADAHFGYIKHREAELGNPYDKSNAAHKAFGKAALAVFELRAVTLAGVLAKMRLARLAVEDQDYSCFIDGPETDWLDDAVADLDRLAGMS